MTLRDAGEADLPAIVAIFNAAVRTRMSTAVLEPVTVAERLAWFHKHSAERYPLWVAEMENQIAGWLSFHQFVEREAYRASAEVSLYVHPDYRRRGIGRMLLEESIARSPALGFSALLGLIFGHNTGSLQLFAQLGFEQWGFLPRVARLDGIDRDVVIVGQHL